LKPLKVFVILLVCLSVLGLCMVFGVATASVVSASVNLSPAPSDVVSYNYSLTVFNRVYEVKVTTNSSLSNFGWTSDGIGVHFQATTPSGSSGFCDFTVPEDLLGDRISLFLDNSLLVKDANFTQSLEGENYVFHVTYEGGTRTIEAKASTVSSPSPSSSPSVTPISTLSPSPSSDAWSPTVENAALAGAVAVGSAAAASAIMSVARPAEDSASRYFEKTKESFSDDGRKWASDFVESKRKLKVDEKKGSRFLPTKQEAVAYAVGIGVLTICYAYAKVALDWVGFLEILPMVLATFMIVEFVKIYVVTAFVRSRGVWAEHKIWPLGLLLLGVTTLAFRVPLSSPTRSVRHGPKVSKHLEVIVASVETLVNLAFSGIFFAILLIGETILNNIGLTLLGSTGLAFCVMMSFFEILPIPPMGSKEVWDHNKALWVALFAAATTVFVLWLLLL
jgi:hypothetical protein